MKISSRKRRLASMPLEAVWQALMSPDAIKEYMFGARVDSDGREGSRPEHYHTVTIDLTGNGIRIEVMLAQDHNATVAARMHSEKNWKMMLGGLKKYVVKWAGSERGAGMSPAPRLTRTLPLWAVHRALRLALGTALAA